MAYPKLITQVNLRKEFRKDIIMRLMRWQRPDVSNWSPSDQWSNLREEINRLFEMPFGDLGRESEFFGWAPPRGPVCRLADHKHAGTRLRAGREPVAP